MGALEYRRSHTIVAVDGQGRQLAVETVATATRDHRGLFTWSNNSPARMTKGSGPSRIDVICPGDWSGIR